MWRKMTANDRWLRFGIYSKKKKKKSLSVESEWWWRHVSGESKTFTVIMDGITAAMRVERVEIAIGWKEVNREEFDGRDSKKLKALTCSWMTKSLAKFGWPNLTFFWIISLSQDSFVVRCRDYLTGLLVIDNKLATEWSKLNTWVNIEHQLQICFPN